MVSVFLAVITVYSFGNVGKKDIPKSELPWEVHGPGQTQGNGEAGQGHSTRADRSRGLGEKT